MELHDLIARVQEGDTEAFAGLVSRYRDMALGYALTLVAQEQQAEDAVQEALVAAYTHLDRLQNPDAFGAWLRGIVRHHCARSQRGHRQTVSWEQRGEVGSEALDPAREAQAKAMQRQVQEAMATLPEAQRDVVRFYYEAGLSQHEIATRLNLTVPTVNMRLHAARTRLRRRLQAMTDITVTPRNSGRVQEATGPVVTVQFAPNAAPPLFSLLTAGGDRKESLCVVQSLSAGRVRALAVRAEALWTPGQEIDATGEPFLQPLDAAAIQRALDALRPESPASDAANTEPLASGIKAIELFAPLTQGGRTGLFAEWGLGVLVLLPELLRHLDQDENRQTFFVFLPPLRDTVQWQEVRKEITAGNRQIACLYLPVADPVAPAFVDSMANLDTTLVLSRSLAEQAIWPCLDPFRCHSRRLENRPASAEQTQLPNAVRELLRDYYRLQFAPDGTAQHTLTPAEWQRVQRARRVLRFLSQPFCVAEPYTGTPGVFVTAEETLAGFSDLMAGRYDTAPGDAFYMTGATPKQQ